MRTHLLVVANQTADAPELLAELGRRARRGPLAVTLVVPTTWDGRVAARRRADAAAAALRDAGLDVDAVLGDADPVLAVQERWDPRRFDEVLVATLPSGTSKWLLCDLPRRVERLTGATVTHLEATPAAPAPRVAPPPARHREPLLLGVLGQMRAPRGAPPPTADAALGARDDARRVVAPGQPLGQARVPAPGVGARERRAQRRPVADEHARPLGPRDGRVDEVAREHDVVGAHDRHDHGGRLAALRLVDRDRVGEPQRPGLGHGDPQRPPVVGVEQQRVAVVVVVDEADELAVHQLALVVVARLQQAVADAEAASRARARRRGSAGGAAPR